MAKKKLKFRDLVPDEKIIVRNRTYFAFEDIQPKSKGHILLAPFVDLNSPFNFTPRENRDLYGITQLALDYLNEKYKPKVVLAGVNVDKNSGRVIDDFHMHLIPNYRDAVREEILEEKQILKHRFFSSYNPKKPITPGHVVIIPNNKRDSLLSLGMNKQLDLQRIVNDSVSIINQSRHPNSYNVIIAGVGKKYSLEFHLIPRENSRDEFQPDHLAPVNPQIKNKNRSQDPRGVGFLITNHFFHEFKRTPSAATEKHYMPERRIANSL